MRKTTAIPINGETIVVRELTPREIDALFDQCRQRTRTTVDDILDVHHLDTVLLGAMLGLAPERCEALVGELTPSEYMPLVEAAKTLNPDFFAMARRRLEYAGQLADMGAILANAYASGLQPSSSTATTTPGITD